MGTDPLLALAAQADDRLPHLGVDLCLREREVMVIADVLCRPLCDGVPRLALDPGGASREKMLACELVCGHCGGLCVSVVVNLGKGSNGV